MLPVSTQHPHTPVYQYPTNSPPLVPQIPLIQEAQPLLIPAAALVANETGLTSNHSAARMFLYNMVSANNWNNHQYNELVHLTIYSAIMKSRSAGGSPLNFLVEAVRDSVMLYASQMVMTYQELANELTREQWEAAASNADLLNQIRAHIDRLIESAQPYQAPMHRTPPGHAAPQLQRHPHPLQHGYGHPPQHHQVASHPAAGGVIQGRTQPPPDTMSRSNNRFPSKGVTSPQLNVVTVNPIAVGSVAEIDTSSRQPYAPHTLAASAAPTQENTMDRDQHMIIYFGKDYGMPSAPVKRGLEEGVKTYESVLEGLQDAEPWVNERWVAGTSKDELFTIIRARYIKPESDTDIKIYQNYGILTMPVLSPIPISDFFTSLRDLKTFSSLKTAFDNYLDGLKATESLRAGLAVMANIDRILTEQVNDWLKNSFSNRTIHIDSFIEDIDDLGKHLHKKFEGKHNVAWQDFQKRLLNWLFQHTRSSDDQVSKLATDEMGEHCDVMCAGAGIIYIGATSKELGYDAFVADDKFISPETEPVLHRLLEAGRGAIKVREQENSLAKARILPSHQYLITLDGAQYGIYRVLDEPSKYRLTEV